MKFQRGFENPSDYRGGLVSIGNFDGVHRGHQCLISVLVEYARRANVPAVVLTFDPHPITIMRPQLAPPSLSTAERKAELLGRYDVDCVIAYPTDEKLLSLSPDQFFAQIVVEKLNAKGLVEGPNFYFGHHRAGNVETLQHLCDDAGLLLEIVPAKQFDGTLVSSSEVRARIAAGNLAAAIELMGHPYQLCGRVVQGAVRGRELGYPTANLADVATQLPLDGVYAGLVRTEEEVYPAAVHLGPNPTFDEVERKLEVHLIGFQGDLYGRNVCVELIDRVRDTRRFDNVDELRRCLERDVQAVCAIVENRQNG